MTIYVYHFVVSNQLLSISMSVIFQTAIFLLGDKNKYTRGDTQDESGDNQFRIMYHTRLSTFNCMTL